ncbi:AraC family transcriptional regulator [Corynebacterium hylobatis]|uniref:AraC family transcriptional regulator n=1 Tax=Corynebacterium hylobatis TaxID=1859290 RepID=A0A430HVJ3_9CORY|nr:AraC family transcriptional regulator [Corynebacterium hylobatis]RSZ61356.1 AraC family transcriptional regulator [Corynebacterium hylobatis]
MARTGVLNAATFDDATDFGASITRLYRPVFHDDGGRRAAVTPVSTHVGDAFRAQLRSCQVDDLVFSTVRASGHEVEYAGSVDPEESALKIYYVLDGTAVIRQGTREQTIGPGQLGVHDSMTPYQVWTDTGFDSLIMVLPKSRLLTLGQGYADLSAARFTSGDGAGRVVLPYLQGLASGLDEITRGHGRQMVRSTVDLLTMLFSSAVGAPVSSPEHQRAEQRADITAWIDDHLLDDDLSPGRIAAAHFMSTRSLHALFAEADTTVGTVIRQRRLERAQELLILHPTMSVAEVGRWSGFPDPSYFTRVFRQEWGCTPGEFRQIPA